ncbi:glutamate 5-kinase [Aeoliella mucimassa]|uniref:Glutamate 5-kinase n=1 Tax=Aeoliella mucimassa TaxID=2527972 RepID=A0A518AJ27_9BACT|nr:glutamate 5-kinase [Aeoliella mucimassa]QDU54731.1 Glutamate 5-kinase [Aeoliella mucimassa]
MSDTTRQSLAAMADTVVVKVGTRVLTHPNGALDTRRVAGLADQLALLTSEGRRVLLVSSGAVGAGIGRLGLEHRPTDLAELQAVASVGQSCLIEAYNLALENHGRHAAQVLLTADDFTDRSRYLNVRNTLFALFRLGAVPIVNENDVVRVDELQRNVGDNDRLAAMVTNLLRAPLLVLLSDVEGVYESMPSGDEPPVVIPQIDISQIASDSLVQSRANAGAGPQLSVGGMGSKLDAARLVATAGERVIIASGRRSNVLVDILAGKQVGTLIMGAESTTNSRKRWIGGAARCEGRLIVDEGASRALCERGSSLLAVGITRVTGQFSRGDAVAIVDGQGIEIARGLSNYSADEVAKIAGARADRIADLLGQRPYIEVVHRDNLALLG